MNAGTKIQKSASVFVFYGQLKVENVKKGDKHVLYDVCYYLFVTRRYLNKST